MGSAGNACCQMDHMTQHNFPHNLVWYGASTTNASVDERVRPNLRLAYPAPPTDHGDDERFAALLAALAQRTGREVIS